MNKRNLPGTIGLLAAICILAFIAGNRSGNTGTSQTGAAGAGWQSIEGVQYYKNSDGTFASGWLELEGKHYYLRQNGSMVTGWLSLEGQRYYLDEDGAVAVGPREIEGKIYLFDDNGLLANGIIEAEGTRYLADEDGYPRSGWAESGNMRYYFDDSGRVVTGWQTIGSFDYYFYSDGSPAAGKTELDGELYCFSSNGQYIPLVNPWHYIPDDYTVELKNIDANHRIASIAYDDYREMMEDCRAAGLDPAVCSSYRTQEYQELLFARKVEYYTSKGYEDEEAAELAGHTVAVPGTSEHQLGLALDIIDNGNWNLNEAQADTATQKWLMENSWRYGWILRYPDGKSELTGIIFEPWHYRYVGREVAAEIYELNICLEEYLDMLTVG